MTARGPYLDTSALAKWYLPEPGSEAFAAYVSQQEVAAISRLTVLEFHSLLTRRQRSRELAPSGLRRVVEAFERQIADGFIEVHPLDDRHATGAIALLKRLPNRPLRALDALHLAIARDLDVSVLATADREMALAAKALGFDVRSFA